MELDHDSELRRLLHEWKTPLVPESLEACVMEARRWSLAKLLRASIRVPVPVACCAVALLGLLAWRSVERAAPAAIPRAVVVRTEVTERPIVRDRIVTKVVYRNRPEKRIQPSLTFHELRPVAELPRIIRGGHDREN